jgi:hypothetical protein
VREISESEGGGTFASKPTNANWAGVGAAIPVHTLRHAAFPDVPSGQQGQESSCSAGGIESAHGISEALVADAGRAVTTGADSSSCAAIST